MASRPKKHPPSEKKEVNEEKSNPSNSNQNLDEQLASKIPPPLFESYTFSAN